MVAKGIVHMHITAELKALLVNSTTIQLFLNRTYKNRWTLGKISTKSTLKALELLVVVAE